MVIIINMEGKLKCLSFDEGTFIKASSRINGFIDVCERNDYHGQYPVATIREQLIVMFTKNAQTVVAMLALGINDSTLSKISAD